jgi:hypothetical protein
VHLLPLPGAAVLLDPHLAALSADEAIEKMERILISVLESLTDVEQRVFLSNPFL